MIARKLALCGLVAAVAASFSSAAQAQALSKTHYYGSITNDTRFTMTIHLTYKVNPSIKVVLAPGKTVTVRQPISDSPKGYTQWWVTFDPHGKYGLKSRRLYVSNKIGTVWKQCFYTSGSGGNYIYCQDNFYQYGATMVK